MRSISWVRARWVTAALMTASALALGVGGCKSGAPTVPAPVADPSLSANGGDPADANLLAAVSYSPEADQAYTQDQAAVDGAENALDASQPPPPLPVYEQPQLTTPGYLWTPGYWGYKEGSGYFWVPGVWAGPPRGGYLWTPGYWALVGHKYVFHYGFWGPHVGFYGGIDYGFGYSGVGYHGGYWKGDHFFYNTAVNHVDTTMVRNVYARPVPAGSGARASFNGLRGVVARPSIAEVSVYHEPVVPPMKTQMIHEQMAASDKQQSFSENHGKPEHAAAESEIVADTEPEALHPAPALTMQGAEGPRPEAAQPAKEPRRP